MKCPNCNDPGLPEKGDAVCSCGYLLQDGIVWRPASVAWEDPLVGVAFSRLYARTSYLEVVLQENRQLRKKLSAAIQALTR